MSQTLFDQKRARTVAVDSTGSGLLMKNLCCLVVCCLIVLCALPVLAQDTTGRMLVRTSDAEETPLPGVMVTISSPALIGGARTIVTDERGEALFLTLGPGTYEVSAVLHGLATQERTEVWVRLGSVTALMVEMPKATFEGEIQVFDETPVVDPMQIGTEQVFDAEYIEKTSIGSWARLLSKPGRQVSGITDGQDVYGSQRSENAWFVDGIEITDIAGGDVSSGSGQFGIDAYQEIEVKTGGYEAEYGRALGGVTSIVMKSGGNAFSGSLDVRYQADSFQESGEHFDPDLQENSNLAVDATFGGPIVRDRLWFFAAFYQAESKDTPEDSPTTRKSDVSAPKAKLTWQISPLWRGTASYFSSTATIENFFASRGTMPEANGIYTKSEDYLSLGIDGMLGDNMLWSLRAGYNQAQLEVRPMSGDLETIAHINSVSQIVSENFPLQQYDPGDRLQAATDLTWLLDGSGGSHELKGGLEVSDLGRTDSNCYTGTAGGVRCTGGISGHVFYDTRVMEQDFPRRMIEENNPGPLDSDGLLRVGFVQDAWRPTPNLTVKAGLRYDSIRYDMDRTNSSITMDRWQPRLGIAWNIGGDARNVLRASAGRYMDPDTMTLPYYGALRNTEYYWQSCSFYGLENDIDPAMCSAIASSMGLEWRTDPEDWDPHGWFLLGVIGGDDNLVDPNLESAYSDQFILSYERTLWPRSSVEFSLVHKQTRGLFEDTCNGNIPTPNEGASCDHYVVTNMPHLERDYDAFIVRLETRTLDWLTLLASYTLSSSKGNHEFYGSTDWDFYPWHWKNRYGYLPSHYRHVLKLNGYFLLPYDFTIAFNAGWQSAFRWTPQQDFYDIEEMPYGTYFVEPRGSRAGADYPWVDLQLFKGFRVGPTHLDLIVSVLNVFSEETPTDVCELERGCGDGFELGAPMGWENPRAWEIGFRLTF